MKIPELYDKKKFVYSFEVFPPKKQDNIDKIYKTVDGLAYLEPDFISVTYGAGGKKHDTLTGEIAQNIKKKTDNEAMAHLTCINSTKKQLCTVLRDLENRGIEKNNMALRGDISEESGPLGVFKHANELAIEIQKINDNIQILGACYPEEHYESNDLPHDIGNLKYKIGAGVKALITQLFFDNTKFYIFMDRVNKAEINVPISAGIMPITNKNQIERTVSLSGSSLPKRFTNMIARYSGAGVLADMVTDILENEIKENLPDDTPYMTGRFSPGYGDLPLKTQRELIAKLDAPRKIGLTLNYNDLMIPMKSVTAIIGISDVPVKGRPATCRECLLYEECEKRKEGRICE